MTENIIPDGEPCQSMNFYNGKAVKCSLKVRHIAAGKEHTWIDFDGPAYFNFFKWDLTETEKGKKKA